jgi:hypothetical protein
MVFGLGKLQDDVFCLTEERDYFQEKFLQQVSEIASLKDDLRNAKKEISKLREELMEPSMTSLSNLPLEDTEEQPSDTNNIDIDTDNTPAPQIPKSKESDDDDDDDDDASSLTTSDEGSEEDEKEDHANTINSPFSHHANMEEEEDTEAKDIRQSAAKLLQWASYRSSVVTTRTAASTPDPSSIASPTNSASQQLHRQSLQSSFSIPRTIQSASLELDDEDVNDETSTIESSTSPSPGLRLEPGVLSL